MAELCRVRYYVPRSDASRLQLGVIEMEGEDNAEEQYAAEGRCMYPEGYEASSYADYYYQQQDGEAAQDYSSHHQQEYSGYYSQQDYDGYYDQQDPSAVDPYQYSYDTAASAGGSEAQGYEHYATGEGYGDGQQLQAAETQESYYAEEHQQLHLDQLTAEQTTGYYYDEEGNLVGVPESPTNVFSQETYWESGQNSSNAPYSGDPTDPGSKERSPQDETDTEGLGNTDSAPVDPAAAEGSDTVATPDGKSPKKKKASPNGRATSPSRKKKTKKQRIQKRQEMLEMEEEERLRAQEVTEAAAAGNNAPGDTIGAASKAPKLSKKKTGFVDREKAKFQLKMRIVKAIKRTRMPVQIRILPTVAAAKGGSVPVVNYLLAAGASPRCLDENGSLPLHLSCWAGHVDASIVLLRSSDVKDLYVQDYDYQDSLWLPKFVEDLIRGIVRYKIKIFKEPPKKPPKAIAKAQNAAVNDVAKAEPATASQATADSKSTEKPADGEATNAATKDSPPKKSLFKRANIETEDRKRAKEAKQTS
ncbi:hypothetical protein ON010_g7072 [Phytophthora cinnamomi]|nr:hypothetical protein ON010_g7072 [Phytophthora cinnamomi]